MSKGPAQFKFSGLQGLACLSRYKQAHCQQPTWHNNLSDFASIEDDFVALKSTVRLRCRETWGTRDAEGTTLIPQSKATRYVCMNGAGDENTRKRQVDQKKKCSRRSSKASNVEKESRHPLQLVIIIERNSMINSDFLFHT